MSNRHAPIAYGLAFLAAGYYFYTSFHGWWRYILCPLLGWLGVTSLKFGLFASKKAIAEMTTTASVSRETEDELDAASNPLTPFGRLLDTPNAELPGGEPPGTKGREPNVVGLEALHALEARRAITIGLHRAGIDTFWAHHTAAGKLFNIGMLVIAAFVIFSFIKWGWIAGLLSVVGLVAYNKIADFICFTTIRLRILKDERLFDSLYESRLATVRDNRTGVDYRFPADWRAVTKIVG